MQCAITLKLNSRPRHRKHPAAIPRPVDAMQQSFRWSFLASRSVCDTGLRPQNESGPSLGQCRSCVSSVAFISLAYLTKMSTGRCMKPMLPRMPDEAIQQAPWLPVRDNFGSVCFHSPTKASLIFLSSRASSELVPFYQTSIVACCTSYLGISDCPSLGLLPPLAKLLSDILFLIRLLKRYVRSLR